METQRYHEVATLPLPALDTYNTAISTPQHTFKKDMHRFLLPEEENRFAVTKGVEDILGQFTYKETLQNGMSGAKILVMEKGGTSYVVKISSKEKTRKESEGYNHLQNAHYKHLLPGRSTAFSEVGILLYEYVPGVEVREGIKKGMLPTEEVIKAVQEIVQAEYHSVKEQPYIPTTPITSMQRQEWEDTKKKIHSLKEEFSFLSQNNISDLPIMYKGKTLPSLKELLGNTEALLTSDPVFPAITHNDATGANIKIQEGKFPTLLDYEWAGHGDLPEALVRLVKYNSSSLLTPEHTDIQGKVEGGKLHGNKKRNQ